MCREALTLTSSVHLARLTVIVSALKSKINFNNTDNKTYHLAKLAVHEKNLVCMHDQYLHLCFLKLLKITINLVLSKKEINLKNAFYNHSDRCY